MPFFPSTVLLPITNGRNKLITLLFLGSLFNNVNVSFLISCTFIFITDLDTKSLWPLLSPRKMDKQANINWNLAQRRQLGFFSQCSSKLCPLGFLLLFSDLMLAQFNTDSKMLLICPTKEEKQCCFQPKSRGLP